MCVKCGKLINCEYKEKWEVHPQGESIISNGKRICLLVPQGGSATEESKANAKRIVHCVNNFDEMLEALKRAREQVDSFLDCEEANSGDRETMEILANIIQKVEVI